MSRQTVKQESVWTGVGGLRMHARVWANPTGSPPVVLVHGIGVASSSMAPTAEELARDRHVYTPDLPGFGDSEGPPDAPNICGLADALAAWMDAVGLDRAALLGNSAGCQVVAGLAARRPGRVERAVLVGPTFDPRARTARQQVWRWFRNNRNERPSQAAISFRDYRKAGVQRAWRTFRHALEDRIEEKLPPARPRSSCLARATPSCRNAGPRKRPASCRGDGSS
jgi:2-hydroxy-6-oxonona-2,4-dienedioate hydrolase